MKKLILEKIKEAFMSVAPISSLVLLLSATPLVNLSWAEVITFFICAICLIIGIALFNIGADFAMTPMGQYVGTGLTKTKKILLLLIAVFVLGLLITIAEPDLSVLGSQIEGVINPTLLIFMVGLGVGLFLLIGVLKIVFKKSLSSLLMFSYLALFAVCTLLILSGKEDLLSLSFDSGGVTTGPITVPFIMALGVGIATTIGGRDANENSFGLIALCSVGPILAVLLLSLNAKGTLSYSLQDYSIASRLGINILSILGESTWNVFKSLILIIAFFLLLQLTILKLPKERIKQIFVGIVFAFLGLVLFLSAVEIGYLPMGFKIGTELASQSKVVVVIFAFIIGMLTVIAEPAVHILNKQVEEITGGSVTKRSMMIALAVGVGVSIALCTIRIFYDFSLLYYLIPGYLISLGLSFFVPGLYTSIAFDSGGVASGPLTSSFVLPLIIGVCSVVQGESSVLGLAFGLVAMVAMTPLIAIQLLGFRSIAAKKVREKIVMKQILDKDDEQIIKFM